MGLVELLVQGKLVTSNSEARRQIEQGGVKVNGEVIVDPKAMIQISGEVIIQKGKRHFLRVTNA